MSNFTAPTLVTSLDTTRYRTQLNANFLAIQQAFYSIQSTLPSSTLTFTGNATWLERATRPSGIVGVLAFVPVLNSDQDTFSIAHSGPDGISGVIINNRLHQTSSAFSETFEDIGITGSGDYVVRFGVRSIGVPLCEMLLEIEDTDNEQELTIWKMDVNRNLGNFTVTNLRLMCDIVMDQDAFTRTISRSLPLTYQYNGILPTIGGRLQTGIVIPFDCEVTGAYVALDTMPAKHTDQNDVVIELARVFGTDRENVLSNTATFTDRNDVGTVRTLTAQSPAYQCAAGDYVYPYVSTPEIDLTDYPAQAAGLSATLLVQQIFHDVLR